MKNIVEFPAIIETVELYFKGTYQGDAQQLKRAFHPHARITGIINQQVFDWSLSDFIERVTASPTALAKDEVYDKKIIAIDVTQHAAIVKAQVVVGELTFTDYITLLKIDNQWIIRNKSFCAIQ